MPLVNDPTGRRIVNERRWLLIQQTSMLLISNSVGCWKVYKKTAA
jgi:hypothetical protein